MLILAQNLQSSNSRRIKPKNRSSYSSRISSKGLLRRPVPIQHQQPLPTTVPQPKLPPDPNTTPLAPGVGGATTQPQQVQQQQPVQQQWQKEASMGSISKLIQGVRTSQDELVDYLIRSKLVTSTRVEAALRAIDRGKYVNRAFASVVDAYQDHPLAIGEGQTISAPHMHAICLELLEPHLTPGARVLDVGSGSGYLSAAMAKMVAPTGIVLGIEKVPELVVKSREALSAANPELLEATPDSVGEPLLKIMHGNALSDVLAHEAPFNAIHVGAAADELHQQLLDKLAPGGRMVIPVGPRYSYQVLTAVDKDMSGAVSTQQLMDVGYVPLTRPSEMEDGQLPMLWRV